MADKIEPLSTSEVLRIFRESEDLDEIKSAVKRASDRIYVTFASVEARDKDGELIPIEDVIRQQDILLERGGPVTDNHSNKVVGKTLAYKVMPSEDTGTLGVLHLNQIYNHHRLDDKVWSETQSGERTGSSVGGQNFGTSFAMVDGLPTKILEQFEHFETANVYGPANKYALNQAVSMVAKSDSMSKDAPEFFMKIGNDVYKIEKVNSLFEEKIISKSEVEKPFAGYKDFDACVKANSDKEDPQAYCATIMRDVEKFINKEDNEVQKEDSSLIVSNDNLIVSENIDKGDRMENTIENVEKGLASLSESDRQLILAKYSDVLKTKKAEDSEEKPEEKKPEEEEVEMKKSQPEDKKPEEANDLETLKSSVAELTKSVSAITQAVKEIAEVSKSSTPRPVQQEAKEEVSKGYSEALEIAMGKKQTSWPDVNKRYGQ